MFSAKYKLLFYASPLNGNYSYWLTLLRMLTMHAECQILGLAKCPNGVFNHLLRVTECKKVIEDSYAVPPSEIIKFLEGCSLLGRFYCVPLTKLEEVERKRCE